MTGYLDFPPVCQLKLVLNSSPESALIFIELWKAKKKAKSLSLSFRRRDIKNTFLISATLFRNHLLSLGRLELVSFEESSDFFVINFFVDERE